MLRQLHIANLAVIADATIDLGSGLNVFTGQTGAGKSLVIGAFEILLGLRKAKADQIRPGADQARISGVFQPSEHVRPRLERLFDATIEEGGELLLTRKLFPTGRSSCAVNGHPVTAAMLAQAAELLVDIHGQHDHQLLLKPAHQRDLLDAFGDLHLLRDQHADTHRQLRQLQNQKQELETTRTLRAQQLDLFEFQADEIDAAEPTEGEFPELQARATVLASVQRLKRDAAACHAALYDADGSVVERLQQITHTLLEVAHLDPAAADPAEQVRTATLTLQEAAFELSRYEQRLDHDPEEAAEVDSRLNTLNRLISKYANHLPPPEGLQSSSVGRLREAAEPDALAPVLAYRRHLAVQIERLREQTQDAAGLDERIAEAERQLDQLGGRLTKKRKAAAKKLLPQVQGHLAELGMPEAHLEAVIQAPNGSSSDTSATSAEVELLARTNPGQATRPLRDIASGGELSRVMLALKSVRQADAGISVLVFDEVDANIGGRLGSVIGQKLRALARDEGHQVLCITHLPQIAAFGHRHFRIAKSSQASSGSGKTRNSAEATTTTTVEPVTGKSRIDELAEMMAGREVTLTTKKQARELLAAAE
ncbi:MAG: DNA repair protein RecN [Planctomycetota bacterium]